MLWAGLSDWGFPFSVSLIPATATPLWRAEPLVPTAAPVDRAAAAQMSAAGPALDRDLLPPDGLKRFGLGIPYPPLEADTAAALGLGWYLSWQVVETPSHPAQTEFWQMVRLDEAGFRPDEAAIRRAAQANSGATWLIGNEPDVIWQDNVTPAGYAEHYHRLYFLLKEADPTCRVVIGAVTQPTPLRLAYLERVLATYQERYGTAMPVDVWNIHNFILREERGSWGVDIPPGFSVDHGTLFEVADHADLEIFKAQIIHFRQWLAERGQRAKPLIVSEYGILMPADYGFDSERVEHFLVETYRFMLTAADEQIGDPADHNHLVQRWAWYSLGDDRYPTSNFINLETGNLTRLGQVHQQFVAVLRK